jgi:hypothetical protein
MTSIEQEFHTGQRAPVSGTYEFVRHQQPVACEPTAEERRVPLARGEVFPPERHCNTSAVWRLVERA